MSRPVRFNITPIEANISDAVSVAEAPDGYAGEGFFTTKLSDVVGLARKNSLWPLPFATSCCGIEFMATMASHYDLARFGAERVGFSPRQCDLLMVMGTISKKMGPVLRQVYLQMAEPRWVISVGACACSAGLRRARTGCGGSSSRARVVRGGAFQRGSTGVTAARACNAQCEYSSRLTTLTFHCHQRAHPSALSNERPGRTCLNSNK